MPSSQQPGTTLTDHVFEVPLDHANPRGPQLTVFAREVVASQNTGRQNGDLPWLCYLQGGPGQQSPRPKGRDGWLDRALRDYRVLLLDQRGTGRSTPANRLTLASLGTPEAQAEYLTHFRADAIVADAELIRKRLTGGTPWSVLGQSFGGFCTLTYLSQAPQGLAEAFITGGLPGLQTSADDVYLATYPLVAAKNAAHYERYPGDVEQARRVAAYLLSKEVMLPSGAPLTAEAFQSLGSCLGMSTGSHDLHYLLEDAFDGDEISDSFKYRAQDMLTFAGGPLYAVLHEACYAQESATRWAAHRIREQFAAFSAEAALDGSEPILFTGEMIFPWMLTTDPVLRPLAEAAELLAHHDGWPRLYDPDQLSRNDVAAAAAVYYDDMYVPQRFSVATAAGVRGLRRWVTSEHEHDGLRVSGGAVLDRLIGMVRGTC
ncbi:MAG TPA: alpha/beta fold hydrolase [Streptosporangiaceae bacterium]|nr:alpha/beta fold hydrolase [Streptosporangiaceae bacterium]